MLSAKGLKMSQVKIRLPRSEDLNFILSSYLKSYRNSMSAIGNDLYFPNQQKVFEEILTRSMIAIACDPEHEDQIFGWGCCEYVAPEHAVLHYLYVKFPFRRNGLAKDIIAALIHENCLFVEYSHNTHASNLITKGYQYNPFYLFKGVY